MTVELENALQHAKALIFDCDGTLVNSFPVYSRAWAAGFALSGKTMNEQWYEARNGLSEHVLMDDFERDQGIALERERVIATMRRHYLDNLDALLVEIPFITDIAKRFSHKLPIAVASGGSREIVTRSLDALSLTHLFQSIVTFDDVLMAKPAPDLFLRAALELGVAPDQCLVFEDSPQGVQAAHAANMPVINVTELDF